MMQVLTKISEVFTTYLIIYTQIECQVHAVDRSWGAWHGWSHCTQTCGDGFQFRYRKCNNLPPGDVDWEDCSKVDSQECDGVSYCDYKRCNHPDCRVRVDPDCEIAKILGKEYCMLPFWYDGKKYDKCTYDDDDHETFQLWCALDSKRKGDRFCHCEGSRAGATCRKTNLARGKPTKQESIADNRDSALAVDGDTNPIVSAGSCTSTIRYQYHPWWTVDLEDNYYVIYVQLFVVDQEGGRPSTFNVGLTNEGLESPSSDALGIYGYICKFFKSYTSQAQKVDCNHKGRHVYLTENSIHSNKALVLCEVEVYGCYGIDGNWGNYGPWSECTATCGEAYKWRTRECNNPPPLFGGVQCTGDQVSSTKCSLPDCDLDECDSAPCQNDGSCTDKKNEYSCDCQDGFTGKNCETDVDYCEYQPCENGGACVDHPNHFSCNCVAGYTGVKCETDINECFSGPCLNKGSCIDGVSEYSCTCPAGSSGYNCEIESKAPLGQKDDPGLENSPLPIAGVVVGVATSVICVIIVVLAIVKYRLKNSSNKEQPDTKMLETVTPTTPTKNKKTQKL